MFILIYLWLNIFCRHHSCTQCTPTQPKPINILHWWSLTQLNGDLSNDVSETSTNSQLLRTWLEPCKYVDTLWFEVWTHKHKHKEQGEGKSTILDTTPAEVNNNLRSVGKSLSYAFECDDRIQWQYYPKPYHCFYL